MKSLMVAVLIVVYMLGGVAMAAPQPMSGYFDIVVGAETAGLSFAPVPWVSPSGSKVVYLWPYATDDYTTGYSGAGAGYNLAQAQFQSGAINVTDGIARSGDLAIRIGNYVGETVTFGATTLTVDLADQGAFDVYLPEFTFDAMDNIHFWVSDKGWTYYANTSMGPGAPNMTAATAIAAGDMYVAAVPAPAAVGLGLLGLGLIGRRMRRYA